MGLINPSKKYKSLLVCGCSFTQGGDFTKDYSWGDSLAKRLGCEKIPVGMAGSSNFTIMSQCISYCENNDMTDVCVGIQWSQSVRREIWNDIDKSYYVVNSDVFKGKTNSIPWVNFEDKHVFAKNESFFNSIWWDYQENIMRTIHYMILVKNYLISKNIDFVMFEGIGSIMDYLPEFGTDELHIKPCLQLFSPKIRKGILNDDTFFSKLGDMFSVMNIRKDFDYNENGGHPTLPICEWWADEMINYMNDIHKL
jgi:hypothetical protein